MTIPRDKASLSLRTKRGTPDSSTSPTRLSSPVDESVAQDPSFDQQRLLDEEATIGTRWHDHPSYRKSTWYLQIWHTSRWRKILSFVALGGLIWILCFIFTHLGFISSISVRSEQLYNNGTTHFKPTVILVSLDGFRNDYLERGVTPTLTNFASKNIKAKHMYPSFPSITFPNHWTLVTGLYPEAHGIVANEFYDPLLQAGFIHKQPEISLQPRWWGGEPIWATSTLQGKRSGVIMWPGAAVPIHSATADYFIDYDRSMSAVDKMDMALKWLDLPLERRPQVIAIYIPQIDQKGHGGGPDGPQMNMVLSNMDSAIEHLLNGLDKRNLGSHVHVVIVSDHGMAATHSSQLIYYDDIIPHDLLPYLEREAWPLLSLRPVSDAPPDIIERVYEALYLYTQSVDEPHFEVYLRQDVPERFHYNSTERIAPIVTIPDPGYSFVTHKEFDPSLGKDYRPRGMHGYDNKAVEMRAIFMARGPTVEREYKAGVVLEPFQNIEVYEFITHIMDLTPAPNNGTLHGMFKAI